MITKKDLLKRTAEQKEKILQDCKRLGVIAGCRKHSIPPTSYYTWLEKFTAHGLDGLRDQRGRGSTAELRRLEKENLLLKEILADKELELKMKDKLLKKRIRQWSKDGK